MSASELQGLESTKERRAHFGAVGRAGDRPGGACRSGQAARRWRRAGALASLSLLAGAVPAGVAGAAVATTGRAARPAARPAAGPPAPAAGAFVAAKPMATASGHATATLLRNGDVLVAGGQTASGTPLASAELYEPASGGWVATAPLPLPLSGATATLLPDGDVLVAGGLTTTGAALAPTGDSELYDAARGSWSFTRGPLAQASYDASAALVEPSGAVLYAGGLTAAGSGAAATANAELFDAATGTWTAGPHLPVAVAQASIATLANGRVLLAGGELGAGGEPSSAAEVYVPQRNEWYGAARMPAALSGATTTLLAGGAVLIAGGRSWGDRPTSASLLFQPASWRWYWTGALPAAAAGATATPLNDGDVLVAGGIGSNSAPGSGAALFDPALRRWVPAAGLAVARAYATAAHLPGGDVLVAGGVTEGGVTASSELYSPSAPSSGPDTPTSTTSTTTTTIARSPARITSPAALTVRVGADASDPVDATGTPTPRLAESGALPPGMAFRDNGNGTATIYGTPAPDAAASYSPTITADNGVGSPAVQQLAVTVQRAPAITSPASLALRVGVPARLPVTTSGNPAPRLAESGALPPGIFFRDNGNGTATIYGTPSGYSTAAYAVTVTADNGVGSPAVQRLAISVTRPVVITSPDLLRILDGVGTTFTVDATGMPVPHLGISGMLPPGLGFVDNGNGTATISGTARPGVRGTFTVDVVAQNGTGGPVVQRLSIVVSPAEAPRFTSPGVLGVRAGTRVQLAVASAGVPTPRLGESGMLPSGLSFHDNGNGTATISGTVAASAHGTFAVSIAASNGIGSPAVQRLSIVVSAIAPPPRQPDLALLHGSGYWYVTTTGELIALGQAHPLSAHGRQYPSHVVAVAATPDHGGYYVVTANGGVFAYGDARWYGSLAHVRLLSPAAAFAVAPNDVGYYLVTRSGRVYGFGDAPYYGSLRRRNLPAVSAFALTPDGRGYYLVTVRGNVFHFGRAAFYGSLAHERIPPVTAFAVTPDGRGYWLVTSTGDVATYGDARNFGTLAARRLPRVVAFAPTGDGGGYWLVTAAGNVFNFGDAWFFGSSAHTRLAGHVTGFAADV